MAPRDRPVRRDRPVPRERPERRDAPPRDAPVTAEPGAARLTADELVAVVRVHLDRVHDAVRRTGGQDGPDAVAVVRASALALVDEVAERGLDAEQAAGTWFRRALELAAHGTGRRPADDAHELGDALSALPGSLRTAVLLRDAYDLPSAAVAAALGTDEDDALACVARGRLAVPAAGAPSDPRELADGGSAAGPAVRTSPTASTPTTGTPTTAGHPPLATLARLAEDRPVAAADATAKRHVVACSSCRASVEGQSRGARVLAAVLVTAAPDRARAAVVREVEQLARERLPQGASRRVGAPVSGEQATGPFALPAAETSDAAPPAVPRDEPRRLLSPLLVVLSVVLAALAGVGGGLLLSQREEPARLAGSDGRLPEDVRLISPQPSPPATLPSPPTVAEQRPRTTVVVVPPSPLPPPPPPSPSPTPSPAAPTLGLQPGAGPDGTELTVTGTGFPPGATVRLDYLDTAGQPTGSGVDAVADGTGSLTATLLAQDPSGQPGPHDVLATAGELTARATFTVEAP